MINNIKILLGEAAANYTEEQIKLLLEQGADIYAYDPVGVPKAKMQFPEGKIDRGNMHYVATIEEALQDRVMLIL